MKLYRIALTLLIGCVLTLSMTVMQTRHALRDARDEARALRLTAEYQRDVADFERGRANAAEDALRQERDRQKMIESGALTPGWLSRRLAIERGEIIAGDDNKRLVGNTRPPLLSEAKLSVGPAETRFGIVDTRHSETEDCGCP